MCQGTEHKHEISQAFQSKSHFRSSDDEAVTSNFAEAVFAALSVSSRSTASGRSAGAFPPPPSANRFTEAVAFLRQLSSSCRLLPEPQNYADSSR
jgi:hypothetical protein